MTRVVLLHPLGARAEFWNDVVSRLRPRTHTLALDLPGHGAAPLPRRGATLEHWAAAVLRRIDAVTREKVVLVGVSLGGLLAQYLAATASDRIAGIVLSNTVATYPEDLRR